MNSLAEMYDAILKVKPEFGSHNSDYLLLSVYRAHEGDIGNFTKYIKALEDREASR